MRRGEPRTAHCTRLQPPNQFLTPCPGILYVQNMAYVRERRRTHRLDLRVTPEELFQIRRAAENSETTVTEFIVTAALDKAQGKGFGFKGTLRRMREAGEI